MAYFSHDADIGIIGQGETLAEALVDAARAVFAIMVDLNQVASAQVESIDFTESNPEFALVVWLNELLNRARCSGLVFGRFELHQDNDHWHGQAWGEPWSDKHTVGTEVKGATLTQLSVKKVNARWEARCVVDV